MNMNLFDTTAATALNAGPGLIVDNFAGGGGASTGIEAALGRAVDIAINHDDEAIRMHEANHPSTKHIRNNIWQIDPVEVTGGKPVELAWFSPDCKHFSKAKGGKPREKSIRDLAWVVVLWAQRVRPSLILLENVEEFRTWGPLDDEGQPIKERAGETFREWTAQLRKEGYKIQWKELRACDYGAPTIRKRFFMIARCDGQPIVWPKPTHGKPGTPAVERGELKPWRTAADIIDWSIPCPSIFERERPLAEKTLRRIAHGIMKFVVNNPSPFIVPLTHQGNDARCYSGDEPLSTVTGANRGELAVAMPFISPVKSWGGGGNEARQIDLPLRTTTTSKGGEHAVIVPHVTKFRSGAIGSAADEPVPTVTANSFIKRPGGAAPLGRVDAVLAPFSSYAQQGGGNRNIEDPHHTICANSKDQNCVVGATMIRCGNGEREGQEPRAVDVEAPLHTVCAQRNNHGLVTAMLAQFNTNPNGTVNPGHSCEEPVSTIATKGPHQAVCTSHLMKMRGTCAHGQPVDEPAPTLTSGGNHVAEVRAFLLKYYGNEDGAHDVIEPLGTVTTKDRFTLVTVNIGGEDYVIVDIGMRMLTPRELFNAQGFPPTYIIDRDAHGNPMTKTAQVAKCGNSVCPPLSEALVSANAPSLIGQLELPEAAVRAA
jgi:DNA (cytosine-5)-methyltransferase 1